MSDDLGTDFATLDEYLSADADEELTGDDVQELRVANARLRRRNALRRQLERENALYLAEMMKLTEWITARRSALGEAIADEERWLANYHRAMLGAHLTGPRRISLPAGTLVARAPSFELEIGDNEVLVKWAQEHDRPDLLRRTPVRGGDLAVDRNALRRLVDIPKGTPPGTVFEVVEGVRAVVAEPIFVVEANEG